MGLLTATMNYYKAYKVNSRILLYINMYAGYNSLSKDKIDKYLSSIGYSSFGGRCNDNLGNDGKRDNGDLVSLDSGGSNYLYCVYYHNDDTSTRDEKIGQDKNADKDPSYYNYSVVTYIYVNLPIVGEFKIPVYTKGERIYNFSDNQSQVGV